MEAEPKKTPNTKTASKPKKKRKLFTEKTAGYYLIAPAMILIFLIAIWPVLQSFYFSLFDLRLNDPTKSNVNLSYDIDLERYLNNYPFFIGALDTEIRKENAPDKLKVIEKKLQSIDQKLQSDPSLKKKYAAVNDKLNNFKEVTSDLSIAKIDRKTAEELKSTAKENSDMLIKISNNVKFTQEKKLLGLASGYKDAVIEPNFIGLQHYKEDLTDSRTWTAMGNTTIFTIISVFVELVLGLAIALLINKAFVGRGLIRASILIPWAIPTAVSALMWKFLYDGQNGVVAKLFESIGLVSNMDKLLVTNTGAMFSVIFSDVWKTTPYMSLLLLAGLQTIPASLYEAASIDGAGKWKQFIKITLPLLKSSILVALLFRTLDAFRVFDLVYVLTGGGPANSTETISILAYKVMFSQTNFGDGSALSVIVFICVAIISMIYIKFLGRDLLNDR